jgi:hypothetical protein
LCGAKGCLLQECLFQDTLRELYVAWKPMRFSFIFLHDTWEVSHEKRINILKNEMFTKEGEIIFCFWEQYYEHFIF